MQIFLQFYRTELFNKQTNESKLSGNKYSIHNRYSICFIWNIL